MEPLQGVENDFARKNYVSRSFKNACPVSRAIYDLQNSRPSWFCTHAHVMRMIAFASYISQLDNNNTRASGFGYGLASEIETILLPTLHTFTL